MKKNIYGMKEFVKNNYSKTLFIYIGTKAYNV